MHCKAVLWDLDGTLLDTLGDLTASVNHALQAQGLPSRSREEVALFTGNGIGKLMERAAPEDCDPDALTAAFKEFCTYYAVHCGDATRPYPGIPRLLQKLQAGGIQCAIVSNKAAFAVKELAKKWFPGTAAFGGGEGIPSKPDPAMVNAALEKLGTAREDALYIGDSEVDVATARNAGLSAIFVTWGFRREETLIAAGATRIVHSVEELEKELDLA